MNRSMKRTAGFTIIEIMIVVGIIGILANLVLPYMRLEAMRAKIVEVVAAFGPCRQLVSEVRILGDDSPGAGNWGCEVNNPSPFVSAVRTTGEGIILVDISGTGDLRLDFHTVSLAPLTSSGTIAEDGDTIHRWRCGATGDGTDLGAKYLPSSCHGS